MNSRGEDLAIGIFDSGMGGISVLSSLMDLMPNEHYIYFGDSKNAPYGIKSVEEIRNLSIGACDFLIQKGVKAIVVACNTATSASINILRKKYDIPIIGMEPAIKPANKVSGNKKIAVLATPITLKERKFNELLARLDISDSVIKIPAPQLVTLVENGQFNGEIVRKQIETYFENIELKEVGAVVLGCTHFIFLRETIKDVLKPGIPIIDGNLGTAKNLMSILKDSNLLNKSHKNNSRVDIYNSSDDNNMIELSKKLLAFLIV